MSCFQESLRWCRLWLFETILCQEVLDFPSFLFEYFFSLLLFHSSVFSDAEKSDCGLRENPAVNYIRLSSRRGQINDQTYVGFLRISGNEPVPLPIRVFHWDTYSMYGSDRDQEFPVYLMDIIGFGENLFVQMETTAPAPIRRRSKKRSQKKASERRLSKQAVVTERWV